MSETPGQPTERDRAEPSRTEDATEQEHLDVAEWVSELRRLYVEPTTHAEQHRESGLAPLRRKLRLRGSREEASPVEHQPVPEQPSPMKPSPASLEGLAQRADPAPETAVPHPGAATELGDGSPETRSEPPAGSGQVAEASGDAADPRSAAWLLSYLEATGASTKDEDAAAGGAVARAHEGVPAPDPDLVADAEPDRQDHGLADEPEPVPPIAVADQAGRAPMTRAEPQLEEPLADRESARVGEAEPQGQPEPANEGLDAEPLLVDETQAEPSPMDQAQPEPEPTVEPRPGSTVEDEAMPGWADEAVLEGEPAPEPAETDDAPPEPVPVDEAEPGSEPELVEEAEREPEPSSMDEAQPEPEPLQEELPQDAPGTEAQPGPESVEKPEVNRESALEPTNPDEAPPWPEPALLDEAAPDRDVEPESEPELVVEELVEPEPMVEELVEPEPMVEELVEHEPDPVLADQVRSELGGDLEPGVAVVAATSGPLLPDEAEPERDVGPEMQPQPEPVPVLEPEGALTLEPDPATAGDPASAFEDAAEPVERDAEPQPEPVLEPQPAPESEPDPEQVRWTRRPSSTPRELVSDELVAEPVGTDEPPGPEVPASTSHPVTVSWRGEDAMDYLELDGPKAVDPDDLIIVEPPSQLFASPRRRRPEHPPVEDPVVEAAPDPPDEAAPPEAPPERGPAQSTPADGPPSRTGRGVLLLVVLLAVLAALVWYFLLRDADPASAVPMTRSGMGWVAAALNPATGQGDLTG